jgi:predicted signal transduction protein with EAL and GGDEF domain
LRLWSQLKPEFVKIDKYFTKDISQHGDKLKTIQALQQIAEIFGTSLIAEGIETAQDLRCCATGDRPGGRAISGPPWRPLQVLARRPAVLGAPDRGVSGIAVQFRWPLILLLVLRPR